MKNLYEDKTQMELFIIDYLDAIGCKSITEIKDCCEFLADCLTTAVSDYMYDNEYDEEVPPVFECMWSE